MDCKPSLSAASLSTTLKMLSPPPAPLSLALPAVLPEFDLLAFLALGGSFSSSSRILAQVRSDRSRRRSISALVKLALPSLEHLIQLKPINMINYNIYFQLNIPIDNPGVILGVQELQKLLWRDSLHGPFEAVSVLTLELFGVDDHLLQFPLGSRPLNDLLVNSVGCHQPVHHHGLGLADPVATILGLEILLGVPIGVVDDASVCSGQIYA